MPGTLSPEKRFALRLTLLRQRLYAGNVKQFTDEHSLTYKTYLMYEAAKRYPTDKTIKLLAVALKVNFEWLASGEGEVSEHKEIREYIAECVEALSGVVNIDGDKSRIDKPLYTQIFQEIQQLFPKRGEPEKSMLACYIYQHLKALNYKTVPGNAVVILAELYFKGRV